MKCFLFIINYRLFAYHFTALIFLKFKIYFICILKITVCETFTCPTLHLYSINIDDT